MESSFYQTDITINSDCYFGGNSVVSVRPILTPCGLIISYNMPDSLQWRHNGPDTVSNQRRLHCLPNHLFRRRSKNTSKLRVTGLCAENSPVIGELTAQMASNTENVSIWWRHHEKRGVERLNVFVCWWPGIIKRVTLLPRYIFFGTVFLASVQTEARYNRNAQLCT